MRILFGNEVYTQLIFFGLPRWYRTLRENTAYFASLFVLGHGFFTEMGLARNLVSWCGTYLVSIDEDPCCIEKNIFAGTITSIWGRRVYIWYSPLLCLGYLDI